MSRSLKAEFQTSYFSLSHHQPHNFVTSQWRCSHTLFIVWHAVWTLWHIAWLIRSIQLEIEKANYEGGAKWLIYLTNISYLILTLKSSAHLIATAFHTKKGQTKQEHFGDAKTSWYHSLIWLLTTVGFDAAILVSILFWTLVFKELKYALTIVTHAINSFYVLADLFVSATPIRILHVVYSVIYAVLYSIFSIIYHLLGGTNSDEEPYIYASLDWSKTGATAGLVIGVVFVAIPVIHVMQFGLYKLRICMMNTCGGDGLGEDACGGKISPTPGERANPV